MVFENPQPGELVGRSSNEIHLLLEDLLRRGIQVAFGGDKVRGCGGMGYLLPIKSGIVFNGRGIATVGSEYVIPSDSHGCMGCPHRCTGQVVSGLADFFVDSKPVAIVGSQGVHAACCGPNTGTVVEGYKSSYVPKAPPKIQPVGIRLSRYR
ncbi:MAG: hypothetical protein OEU50_15330 [Gammaproteobacteria bacterium]|nr:hypothetical protein [Gammaproteobacteria bacterium]